MQPCYGPSYEKMPKGLNPLVMKQADCKMQSACSSVFPHYLLSKVEKKLFYENK